MVDLKVVQSPVHSPPSRRARQRPPLADLLLIKLHPTTEPPVVPAPPPSRGQVQQLLPDQKARSTPPIPQTGRPSFWSPQLPGQQSVEDFPQHLLLRQPPRIHPLVLSQSRCDQLRPLPTLLRACTTGTVKVRKVLGPKQSLTD